ncbi:MAG: hypothetical protein PHN31_02695 [Candidatus Gracilibacteria bacterium]|nr:hypothetical protein [Candidatus Gracilibacteria bacterium]
MFKTFSNATLLIKIGKNCPANCENCEVERIKEEISFLKFFDTLNLINEKFDKNFSIFLFGIDFFENIDSMQYIKFFIENGFNNISLQIKPYYTEKQAESIENISKIYPNISFDFIYHINTKEEIKDIIKFLNYYKDKNKKISGDLFISHYFQELIYLLKSIGFRFIKGESSHNLFNGCIEAKLDNITIIIYKKNDTISTQKNICPFDNCIAYNLFKIDDNYIIVNEEIEINYEGNLSFHFNVYCSKYMRNVTNLFYENKKIIKDFDSTISEIKKTKCELK